MTALVVTAPEETAREETAPEVAGRAQAPVVVVGAGIAGVACARELRAAGLPVVVRDRGRRVGGRMAVRTVEGRPVDVGASYLTARDPAFVELVEDWEARGLARRWTDTFATAGAAGLVGATTGPLRWAAPRGLRSLVEDLAADLEVESGAEVSEVAPGPLVDGLPARAVVLAMPDPQARDLLSEDLAAEVLAAGGSAWEPVLALYAAWDQRTWAALDGVFVNDADVLGWVADDGRRRGDDAPVLVAHSTASYAATHLDDPAAATGPMLAALRRLLGIRDEPRWAEVKRWSLARPARSRSEPFHLGDALVGLCGDGWHGPPRVEAAFLSGRALGRELARRLR